MEYTIPHSDLPRILIIGGGFGGITLAKSLKKAPYQVVMIDKNNYHTFQPLLYQVATGGLEPDSIAFPLRKLFEGQKNFVFRMAEVEAVRPESKGVETSIGDIRYDYLVMATGSNTNFFGQESVQQHAVGMKSIPEALDLRSLILQNFEQAHQREEEEPLMNFVVVGGGPTGVETSGALAELKRFVLPNDYPELDFEKMDIYLVEAGDQLLGGMSDKSSKNAKKALEKLGVHVLLNTLVTDYDGKVVHTKQEDVSFEAATVIWAAGIEGNVPGGLEEEAFARGKRVEVDAYNRVHQHEDIFVIGDAALMRTEAYPNGHPQVAPTAIQQGQQLAKNFQAMADQRALEAFEYYDKGSMATVGRNKAVVDFRNLHFKGLIAWLTWMFVHLLFLLGFRNKLVVFVNWVWSYFTYDKGTRLIIRPFKRNQPQQEPPKEPSIVNS